MKRSHLGNQHEKIVGESNTFHVVAAIEATKEGHRLASEINSSMGHTNPDSNKKRANHTKVTPNQSVASIVDNTRQSPDLNSTNRVCVFLD